MKQLTLALALLLTGCVSVPKTVIRFNPKTDSLEISSPKDVSFKSANVTKMGNGFTLSLTDYSSTNNAAVVSTVTQAQAAIAKNASDTIQKLADLAASAVAKAP